MIAQPPSPTAQAGCPCFFKEEDKLYYSATGLLQRAEVASGAADRDDLARQAVTLMSKVGWGMCSCVWPCFSVVGGWYLCSEYIYAVGSFERRFLPYNTNISALVLSYHCATIAIIPSINDDDDDDDDDTLKHTVCATCHRQYLITSTNQYPPPPLLIPTGSPQR